MQCPYIRYGVYDGTPYELGTEGVGGLQFARKMYAEPQDAFSGARVDDTDLEIFVKDTPFNYAIEQALDHLSDPGVLAEVSRLRTLVAQLPIYADLARVVQELSNAVHQFQKHFNEKTGEFVVNLDATKKRMEAARASSRVQFALTDLARMRQLRGRFYWPDIPGMPEDPNRHYTRAPGERTARDEYEEDRLREGVVDNPAGRLGCISADYRATQQAYNVCRLCERTGHWIKDCEEPHTACAPPYCDLRSDHPHFHMQECRFPRRPMGKRGSGKRKREGADEGPNKIRDQKNVAEAMIVDDASSLFEESSFNNQGLEWN